MVVGCISVGRSVAWDWCAPPSTPDEAPSTPDEAPSSPAPSRKVARDELILLVGLTVPDKRKKKLKCQSFIERKFNRLKFQPKAVNIFITPPQSLSEKLHKVFVLTLNFLPFHTITDFNSSNFIIITYGIYFYISLYSYMQFSTNIYSSPLY